MKKTFEEIDICLSLFHLILLTTFVYVVLHLLDERILGFPVWAEALWKIPNYATFRWLQHNGYFVAFVGAGFMLYRRSPQRLLPIGLGIVIWGLMTFLGHLVYSIIRLEYSPGLFSGLFFMAVAILVYQRLRQSGELSSATILLSILVALLYWIMPICLFIGIDRLFELSLPVV
jgi:hypothetical protein